MKRYNVKLIGFFGEVVFEMTLEARSRVHALAMTAAAFFNCYRKAEIKEV